MTGLCGPVCLMLSSYDPPLENYVFQYLSLLKTKAACEYLMTGLFGTKLQERGPFVTIEREDNSALLYWHFNNCLG